MPIPGSQAGMGAIVRPGGSTFRVWAPNASQVAVAGPFNQWNAVTHLMVHEGDGYWSCDLAGVSAGDTYKFVITNKDNKPPAANGQNWRVDAYARDVDDTGTDVNGIVVDTKNDWGGQWSTFGTPRYDDLILYQVHIGSFCGCNDGIAVTDETATFIDFTTKLRYIKSLGFNALALLPLGEYQGSSGLGYAPTNWFAPETAYGSPADLRKLIDQAHQAGLAVIFDVVYNHASTSDNRYWEYDGDDQDGGIYFKNGGDSEFGKIPAHWKKEVRNFFLDNARMLLEEFRGDGLRFDAAHLIQWESLKTIINGVRANEFWRDKYLIAEWTGDDRQRWPYVISDLGFNSVWGMAGPWAFAQAMTGDDPINKVKSVSEIEGYQHHWNVIRYFLGSHDQIKDGKSGGESDHRYPVEKFGGRQSWPARAQCRLGWALSIAVPGVPMLFMGCEGHHHGYWWPSLDANPLHQDHRLDWSIMGDSIGAPMQQCVRDANNTRWQNPALRSQTREYTHHDWTNQVLAFRRWNDQGNVVLVVINLGGARWSNKDYGVATGSPGQWQEIFNSQAPQYDGFDNSGNAGHSPWTQEDGNIYINLPEWSVLIFRKIN